MYIKSLEEQQGIFEGYGYRVIVNPQALIVGIVKPKKQKKKALLEDAAQALVEGNLSEPNYLVVNVQTKAVEFASDQLPTSIEVTKKLSEHMRSVMDVPDLGASEKVVPIKGH